MTDTDYLDPALVTRVRIVKDETVENPWQVDGTDRQHEGFTELVANFPTWQQAVDSIPAFVATLEDHRLIPFRDVDGRAKCRFCGRFVVGTPAGWFHTSEEPGVHGAA